MFIPTSAKNNEWINSLFGEIPKKYTGSTKKIIKKDEGDEPYIEEEKKLVFKITKNKKEKKQTKKKEGFANFSKLAYQYFFN